MYEIFSYPLDKMFHSDCFYIHYDLVGLVEKAVCIHNF